MFCKNCGKQIADDSKFCLYCGTELFADSGAAPKQVYSDAKYEAAPPVNKASFDAPRSFSSMQEEASASVKKDLPYDEEFLKQQYAKLQVKKAKSSYAEEKRRLRKEKRQERKDDFKELVDEGKQDMRKVVNGNVSLKDGDMPGSKMLYKYYEFDHEPNRVKKRSKIGLIVAAAFIVWILFKVIFH